MSAHSTITAASYGKRDLHIWQKRPTHMAKETYTYGKRDLLIWQKRPSHMANETYSYGKRDLLIWQKRPTHTAKAAYSYGKRDLRPSACAGGWQLDPSVPRPCMKTASSSWVSSSWAASVRLCRPSELCVSVQRDIFYGKRDLIIWQKRPKHMAKETYYSAEGHGAVVRGALLVRGHHTVR